MSLSRFALLSVALLAGCATMSPEQRAAACNAQDWQRYGLNDGKLGVPVSARLDEFQNCAEVGVPADVTAYEAGRKEGLVTYCTAENGFKVGYEGRRYANVCPPELEPDFLQGFKRGRNERPAYSIYPRIGVGVGYGYYYPGWYYPYPPYWCGYWSPHCY
jgi:hypothetical protein